MKLVIQRASRADVRVEDTLVGEIDSGMVVFIAIEAHDNTAVADKIIQKLLKLRIFSQENGKMNLSVQDIQGGILLISQFTLTADLNKGHRPSFHTGVDPDEAKMLYDYLVKEMSKAHNHVAQGIFAAEMKVSVENDGPATFLMATANHDSL